jgi:hypothetical protein
VAAQTVHITIDVQIEGDEISGQVHDCSHTPSPFWGWLGLIGALDRLLGAPSSTADEQALPSDGNR